ncbi:methionine ABC transporter ATP-binding protein [Fodinicurvata sp. CAU 1616]|uniref:Methionine ABC transporter ATP-binding protein n=2 Tax=Aquibaculum arenosum TaxID=3032591 RepID=A0ABT5YMX4_9PROT|nr:methionine ABC transporter ATP-binding protein [Fodinicurvata sp. CAU 1616]
MSSMIRLEAVSKRYPARKDSAAVTALSETDLTIDRGEIFGVIGRSGAGKSTLIRLINLLERPSSGRVEVDGVDLTALDASRLRAARRQIGMIFQHFNLLSSRTVFDNVALPLELAGLSRAEIKSKVQPLLELVGLADKSGRYPAELSGGQKQRVGIARALATEPKVLLCDEATSALDPETTRSILALLGDINEKLGITIVLITHEMQVIKQICHRVAVLDAGAVVELASVESVFTRPRAPITRSLLSAATGDDVPPHLRARLSQHPIGGDTLLRLRFSGPHAESPVISRLTKAQGIEVSILHGQVDVVRHASFGTLIVALPVAGDALAAAIRFLESENVVVEPLGYLPASLRAAG